MNFQTHDPEAPAGNTKQSTRERKHYPGLVKCRDFVVKHKQPILVRMVDNIKMPVSNKTDYGKDIQ